jgi:hypothetical protein
MPGVRGEVGAHYALIMLHSDNVNLEMLGYGHWKREEVGMALLVISLALTSERPPTLPNPLRPNFTVIQPEIKVPVDANGQATLLESYGFTESYLNGFAHKAVQKYPESDGHFDLLYNSIMKQFKAKDVRPIEPNKHPDQIVFANARLGRSVRSSTLRAACIRRTKFHLAGPSLQLPPSLWTAREVWSTGGLVTFSPTFILRKPDKFAEIMQMIACTTNWAAYITPQVMLWAEASWREPV